jgi:predicted ATP-dependent endonuclease of OLD family
VNTKILESPKVAADVEEEIRNMMKQTDDSWNPHANLEFLKVAIRSTIANKVMKVRRGLKEDIQDLEEEIDDLEKMRIRWIEDNGNQKNIIDQATRKLRSNLTDLRNKLSNTAAFISRAKWFEFGERSNQFFLNLNKSRQKQKFINNNNNNKPFIDLKCTYYTRMAAHC